MTAITDWDLEAAESRLCAAVLRQVRANEEAGALYGIKVSTLSDSFPGEPIWCVVKELERLGLVSLGRFRHGAWLGDVHVFLMCED